MMKRNEKESPARGQEGMDGKVLGVVAGRLKWVVIHDSLRVSAQTLEDAIRRHPAVKECAVVEIVECCGDHAAMAYIAYRDEIINVFEAQASISSWCRSLFEEDDVPRYYQDVKAIPRTPENQYDYQLLKEQGEEFLAMLD